MVRVSANIRVNVSVGVRGGVRFGVSVRFRLVGGKLRMKSLSV